MVLGVAASSISFDSTVQGKQSIPLSHMLSARALEPDTEYSPATFLHT